MEKVKGFGEYSGENAGKRERIKKIIQRQFELYGFEPAETPIVESEDFVLGENKNDDAVRDVFKLKDRGKRKLALRYEFTFQLKRLAKNQKLPYKRFQIGYNFRDEPIKKGRTRQFIQCDADTIGSTIKDEAECLSLAKNIFEELKIPTTIYINNRKLLNEILEEQGIKERFRIEVIREIDKLDKLSSSEVAQNLKKYGAEKILKIFKEKEKFFEKYNYYKEIKELKQLCKIYGISVEFRPFLARGFSYYNGTVFEVWSKKLNVAICGGGSYLVNDIQSTGISFGLEPIFLLSEVEGERIEFQVISIGQDEKAVQLAQQLREKGRSVFLMLDKSIGKAMEYANSKKIEKVIFVGKEEVEKAKYKVKEMVTGKEEMLNQEDL